ncbi:hypothetical protein ACP3V3_01980 [Vibrio sp. PNB22_3_1]
MDLSQMARDDEISPVGDNRSDVNDEQDRYEHHSGAETDRFDDIDAPVEVGDESESSGLVDDLDGTDVSDLVADDLDDFERDGEVGVSRSSVASRALAVGQVVLLSVSMIMSSYAIYTMNESRSDYVLAEQLTSYAQVSDLNEIGMDVAVLSGSMQELAISARLESLESASVDFERDLNFLRDGLGDLSESSARMNDVTQSVNDIRAALSGVDFVSRVDLQDVNDRISGVQVGVLKLSDRMQELELEQSVKPVPSVVEDDVESVATDAVIRSSVQKDVRYSIGALRVEDFIRYADRHLIVLGDGVSGTVQLVAGNRLGRYVIDRVDEDSARVLDTLSSKKFTLRKEQLDD